MGEPVLLTLTSGSIEAAAKRNIDCVYAASTLNGYFKHCHFVFYLADGMRRVEWSDAITLYDFRDPQKPRSKIHQQLHFLKFCKNLIRREKVTVIQVNDPYILGVTGMLLSWMTGVPYAVRVVCDYDHYYDKFKRLAFPVLRFRALEKIMEHLVFRFANGVIPWTENYKRYALKNAAPPEKTVIVPAFVDPKYFDHAEPFPPPEQAKAKDVLLYLGRLSWDKYCMDLIDSLADIVKQRPQVLLVVLGGGELQAEFLAKAQTLGVRENVFLAGHQNVDQIRAWAQHAKVMLAPHAGFSLVELGAVGIPVVAYDYEWHGELVANGETGFLVKFRDPGAMAARTLDILNDNDLQNRMRRTIAERTRAIHHPEAVKVKMREFFASIQKPAAKGA